MTKDKQDVDTVIQNSEQDQEVLHLFKKYGLEFYPMCTPVENLASKAKFKQFFDIAVVGFFHSAYLTKDLQNTIKESGNIFVEKSRYIIPKRK